MLIRQNVVPAIAHGEDSRPRGKAGKLRKNITQISLNTDDVEWIPAEWADPATETDFQIIEQIAVGQSKKLLTQLSQNQKIVLMCKLLELPLDSAIKASIVSCKKTQLAIRYKEVIKILQDIDWGFKTNAQEQFALSRALIFELHKWAEGPELAEVRDSIIRVGRENE